MTLLVTIYAAVISTFIWYKWDLENVYRIGTLSLMYWGAAIMWFIDAVYEYAELKDKYFSPSLSQMVNDTFLGISVIALGLVAWIAILIVKDPKHVIRQRLFKKN